MTTFATRLRYGFYAAMFLVFAYVGLVGRSFGGTSKYLPMLIGFVGVSIILADVVTMTFAERQRRRVHAQGVTPAASTEPVVRNELATDHSPEYFRGAATFVAWILAYALLLAAIGFEWATGIFLAAYLRRESEWSWIATVLGVALSLGALLLLADNFRIDWPDGFFR